MIAAGFDTGTAAAPRKPRPVERPVERPADRPAVARPADAPRQATQEQRRFTPTQPAAAAPVRENEDEPTRMSQRPVVSTPLPAEDDDDLDVPDFMK